MLFKVSRPQNTLYYISHPESLPYPTFPPSLYMSLPSRTFPPPYLTCSLQAPPEADIQWDIRAIQGVHKWLHRVWRLAEKHIATCRHTHSRPQEPRNQKLVSATHRAIKQVTVFLGERHTFNTAVSELMILSNVLRDLEATESQSREYHEGLSTLIVLLAPMAPHFSSELWERLASTRTAFSGQQQTKVRL